MESINKYEKYKLIKELFELLSNNEFRGKAALAKVETEIASWESWKIEALCLNESDIILREQIKNGDKEERAYYNSLYYIFMNRIKEITDILNQNKITEPVIARNGNTYIFDSINPILWTLYWLEKNYNKYNQEFMNSVEKEVYEKIECLFNQNKKLKTKSLSLTNDNIA